MDYSKAVHAVSQLTDQRVATVNFVTPIVSVCLAAVKIAKSLPPDAVCFSSEATGYAENCGLRYHLGHTKEPPGEGFSVGLTYCKAEKLANPSEVEHCNANIGRFLRTQLQGCANQDLVAATCGVVGELHDNVVSHAGGCGFSAAQYYKTGKRVIQIGLADCGRGLNGSVSRMGAVMSDEEAIQWCLRRGNTTAKSLPDAKDDLFGPQRLPLDSISNPYPPGVATRVSDNHHMGEGLFRLTELIRNTGGKTWIWSGSAQFLCSEKSSLPIRSNIQWQGTAIEIELPVAAFETCQIAQNANEFEALAKRLNL